MEDSSRFADRDRPQSEEEWQGFARACAEDAHENHFSSRRGTWYFEDLDVVVLYDNNPTKDPEMRQAAIMRLRRELAAAEVEQLASAVYPTSGLLYGYTWLTILDASRDREEFIRDLWGNILSGS